MEATLRAIRSRECLTQEQLARLTGIPRRPIFKMENGHRPISKENANKLKQALKADFRTFPMLSRNSRPFSQASRKEHLRRRGHGACYLIVEHHGGSITVGASRVREQQPFLP